MAKDHDNNRWSNKDNEQFLEISPIEEDDDMATCDLRESVYKSNPFEITVDPENFEAVMRKLKKPGLSKEFLEECKRVANLYRKSSE